MRLMTRLTLGLLALLFVAGAAAQDCLPDQIRCGGTCIDPLSSAQHCGACDVACYIDEACQGGQCALVDSDDDGWSDREENLRPGICDANDPDAFPQPEICDGLDNDCNGAVDEGASSAGLCPATENSVCVDSECSGGNCNTRFAVKGTPCGSAGAICNGAGACVLNPGSVPLARDFDQDGFVPPTDCNDHLPFVRPGFAEQCDGYDNDCDLQIDEGVSCDDGNACTSNDRCAGSCRNRPRPNGTPCGSGSVCIDVACVSLDMFGNGFEPAP